jgi:hypothetical protein
MKLARSTFVDTATAAGPNAALLGLGDWMPSTGANLGGYNLTWLRPRASAGLVTTDEHSAPVIAWRHLGSGRSAAITAQIGGQYGREFTLWEGFAPLSVSLLRWLSGREELPGTYASARREGGEALVQLELEPGVLGAPDPVGLRVRLRSPSGRLVAEMPLDRNGENSFQTRLPLGEQGVYVGEVVFGDGAVVPLPPVSLPYSPELERSTDGRRGARLLERIALESGGDVDPIASDLFRGARIGRAWSPLTRWLALAALAVVLVEIAFRRLQLWGLLRFSRAQGTEKPLPATVAGALAAASRAVVRGSEASQAPDAAPAAAGAGSAPAAREESTLSDALAKARARAQRGQQR